MKLVYAECAGEAVSSMFFFVSFQESVFLPSLDFSHCHFTSCRYIKISLASDHRAFSLV